ncbi:ABC transporter ATP-binding protein/permease [Sporolactobacillus shoreicorticis]|uniref:ABC transporter ATP-binding protein n=1 Tax=Sporolactobacillus shoreicorticis TaxID=1923877 RepID=A0ABW5S2T7_9BACL|nr:ABC transporter ATP-binding protein [Sporolactobacillus shoreicorticis]MCO7126466.1 ABC transporter ATP-binding protein/permease [Sporolactobacillus shoreicorticis]
MNTWKTFRIIYDFTQGCRGIMLLSILCAIISVVGGLIPYWGIYQMLLLFLDGKPTIEWIGLWFGICVAGYVVKLLFYGLSTTLSHCSAYQTLESIRLAMTRRLIKAPLGTVLGSTAGRLKNIIVDRVETIELPLAHLIPEGISNLLLPVAVFAYMVYLDWRIALASIVCIVLGGIVYFIMMKNFSTQYDAYMEASNHVNSVMVEYVEGVEVIKAFNQSSGSYEKFTDAIGSFRDFTLDWFRSTWKLMNLGGALLPSTLLGILPVGVLLYIDGSLTPAELTLCMILSLALLAPVNWFTVAVNDWKSIEYAISDANELLRLPTLPDTAAPVNLASYEVRLSDVSFRYNDKDGNVLNHINLTLASNQMTALVGPSGSGKSTVARLIARFWDLSAGKIMIGGIDIRDLPLNQLSELISFVTQDNFLFNCSLLENIRLGNPKATDQEVYAAARAAQCDEFIGHLEKGWHTMAGEAGNKLSGGERQRIAIARAILKNAPIVILDEATAFTDPENENQLQQSIAALTQGKTLLVIAHRLSTIKDADQIVLLNGGSVVTKGTQTDLLEHSPLYRKMWQAHIGAKEWAAGDGNKGGNIHA